MPPKRNRNPTSDDDDTIEDHQQEDLVIENPNDLVIPTIDDRGVDTLSSASTSKSSQQQKQKQQRSISGSNTNDYNKKQKHQQQQSTSLSAPVKSVTHHSFDDDEDDDDDENDNEKKNDNYQHRAEDDDLETQDEKTNDDEQQQQQQEKEDAANDADHENNNHIPYVDEEHNDDNNLTSTAEETQSQTSSGQHQQQNHNNNNSTNASHQSNQSSSKNENDSRSRLGKRRSSAITWGEGTGAQEDHDHTRQALIPKRRGSASGGSLNNSTDHLPHGGGQSSTKIMDRNHIHNQSTGSATTSITSNAILNSHEDLVDYEQYNQQQQQDLSEGGSNQNQQQQKLQKPPLLPQLKIGIRRNTVPGISGQQQQQQYQIQRVNSFTTSASAAAASGNRRRASETNPDRTLIFNDDNKNINNNINNPTVENDGVDNNEHFSKNVGAARRRTSTVSSGGASTAKRRNSGAAASRGPEDNFFVDDDDDDDVDEDQDLFSSAQDDDDSEARDSYTATEKPLQDSDDDIDGNAVDNHHENQNDSAFYSQPPPKSPKPPKLQCLKKRTKHLHRPRKVIDEDGGTDDERLYDDFNLKNNNPPDPLIESAKRPTYLPTELPLRFIQQQLVDEIRAAARPLEVWLWILLCISFFLFAYSPYFFIYSDADQTSWATSQKTFLIVDRLRSVLVADGTTSKVQTFEQFETWINETLVPTIWGSSSSSFSNKENHNILLEKDRYTFLGAMRVRIINQPSSSSSCTSVDGANVSSSDCVNDNKKQSSLYYHFSPPTTSSERNPSFPGIPLFSLEHSTSSLNSDNSNKRLIELRKQISDSSRLMLSLHSYLLSQNTYDDVIELDGGYTSYIGFNETFSSQSSSSSTRTIIKETFAKLNDNLIHSLWTRFVMLEWFIQVHNSPLLISAKIWFEVSPSGLWIRSSSFLPFVKISGFGGGDDFEQVGTISNSRIFNFLLFNFLVWTVFGFIRFFYDWIRVFRLARFAPSASVSSSSNSIENALNDSQVDDDLPDDSSNDGDGGGENENDMMTMMMHHGNNKDRYGTSKKRHQRGQFSDLRKLKEPQQQDVMFANAQILLRELEHEEEKGSQDQQQQQGQTSAIEVDDESNNKNDTKQQKPNISSSSSSPLSSIKFVNQAKVAISYFFQPWNVLDLLSILLCLAICALRIVAMAVSDSQNADASSRINQVALWSDRPQPEAQQGTENFGGGTTTSGGNRVYPDVLDILATLFAIDKMLGAIGAILLLFRGLKFLTGKDHSFILSLIFETLSSCKHQLFSLIALYMVILLSFSFAGHVAFGSLPETQSRRNVFRTFSSSFFSLFLQSTQLIGGGVASASSSGVMESLPFTATASSTISQHGHNRNLSGFSWIYIVVFTLIVNFIIVNCFIAIIVPAFSATSRSQRHDVPVGELGSGTKQLLWTKFLKPFVQLFTQSPQHSIFRKYFSLRSEGKSYQKLLVIMLKYVKERADFLEGKQQHQQKSSKYQVGDDETQQNENTKNGNGNQSITTTTTPDEMLEWIPEELLIALAPLSLSSVVPSSTSPLNFYRFGGGVVENPSFHDTNRRDLFSIEQYLMNKNVLKMNAARWEDDFEVPLDDYYLQLWMRWAKEYEKQTQGERRKEMIRLKRNVVKSVIDMKKKVKMKKKQQKKKKS